MKRSLKLAFFIFLLTPFIIFSQSDSVQLQINRDVWYPFIETYSSFDDKGFMAIHTEDVIRIIRDAKRIQVGAEYAESMARSAKNNIKRNRKRFIEFSFLERFATGDTAFEVGYYKVISEEPRIETKNYYGIFQVILKQTNGKWKIMVDSDTSMDNSLTEEDFLKGELLK